MRLLIIYHSQSGSTERMALAVCRGARREREVEVVLKRAQEAGLADLSACDGLIVGSPENFGFMAGAVKDFFDRTFYPAQPLNLKLPYAVFISAGNDGSGAVRQIERIVRGFPFKKIADPVICRGEVGEDALRACEDLGQAFSAGMAMGIF